MRPRINLAVFFVTISLVFGLPLQFARAQATQLRTIRVGVAVSPGMKADQEWKHKFEQRLGYASKIFQSEFKLKFKPVYYRDWPVRDENKGMTYLLQNLKNDFPLEGVDIVIGLSRLDEGKISGKINDMHVIGRAQIFAGYLVLRDPLKPLLSVQHETVLTHELGHLFGAIHVNQRDSLMSPVVERQIPTRFDSVNREIVSVTRDINFQKGMDSIRRDSAKQLLGSYLQFQNEAQSYGFYFSLGKFYVKLGKSNEAVKAWLKAIELDSENPQVHYDLGVLYSRLGQTKKSIKELTKAVSLFTLPGDDPYKAAALNLLGASYFQQENLDAAHRAWSRSAAMRPDNLNVRLNLAIVEMQRKRYDEAIKGFSRIIEKGGENPKVLSNLGSAYFQMGDYEKAVSYLKRALKVTPKQTKGGNLTDYDGMQPSELHDRLGHSYLRMDNRTAAIQHFQAACELNPTVTCHRRLGELFLGARLWEQAIREFTGVLRYSKDDPNLYGMLGAALAESGDTNRAISTFRDGLEYARDAKKQAEFHQHIGKLYMKTNNLDSARKEFQVAIMKNFKAVDAHYGLAHVFLKNGRPESARDSLKRVLQMSPNHARAQALLRDIERKFK